MTDCNGPGCKEKLKNGWEFACPKHKQRIPPELVAKYDAACRYARRTDDVLPAYRAWLECRAVLKGARRIRDASTEIGW